MKTLSEMVRESSERETGTRMVYEELEKAEAGKSGSGVARTLSKGAEALSAALERFRSLGFDVNCISEGWLNESAEFEERVREIESRIREAKNCFDALYRHNPRDPNPRIDRIVTELDFYCHEIDGKVSMSNNVVFKLVASGEWKGDDALRYKNLYIELTETVGSFYNLVPMKVPQWKMYVRKTKNVKGELLKTDAEKPSVTENRIYPWLTDAQWNMAFER